MPKRFLMTLVLLVALLVSVSATPIAMSIQSIAVAGYRYGGTTATLRVYANQDFTSSTGEIIKFGSASNGSGFYRSYNCAVSGTTLTLPAISDLPTTTDSPDVPSATYTAVIYDYKGTKRDTWMVFGLSHVHTSPQDWSTIRAYNNPPGAHPPSTYPTSDAVALMIANGPRSGVGTSFTPGSIGSACVPGDIFYDGGDGHYYACPTTNQPSAFLTADQFINATSVVPVITSSVATDAIVDLGATLLTGNVLPFTPVQSETLNIATVPLQEFSLVVTTSGTSSFTVTFGTNFKTAGTLATGTVSGKVFVMRFLCNSTFCAEVSRTTAL